MPIEIGLLSTQQDSFDHHEELSKLLTETDVNSHVYVICYYVILFRIFPLQVFYVPLRNELSENKLNAYRDLTDLTKRFDEDLSNKHLVVVRNHCSNSLHQLFGCLNKV